MSTTTERLSPRDAAPGHRLPIDDAFDVSFAGELARLESYNKHHYRPNSYLHKWWARRCGSTFRLILKHLARWNGRDDYYAAGGLEGKIVLDPMMGGGTTLHEAIRLGASVAGFDVDPIPVLQARATLTPVPPASLKDAFHSFFEGLQKAIGRYWHTQCPSCDSMAAVRFMLYGARRACRCGPVIVVDSLVLRYEQGKEAIRLCPRCHDVIASDDRCTCHNGGSALERPPLVEKGQATCTRCGERYESNETRPFYARYTPLVVAGHCAEHGLFFSKPDDVDMEQLAAADARRQAVAKSLGQGFAVEPGPKARDLLNHGICDYRDLFSSRQLLYLFNAARLLEDYDDLLRLKLALLVSTSLEFNVMLCGYKGVRRGDRPGAIRHAFAHHGYVFPYTAVENNMLFEAKASGTLRKIYHDRLWRAQQWAKCPRERQLDQSAPRFVPVAGERDEGVEVQSPAELGTQGRGFFVRQQTAARMPLPDNSVDYVVTDPPYYDNVQYSDLAAFFRVWLPRLAPEDDIQQWYYDLSEVAVDSLQNGNGHYGRVLRDIFVECRRVIKHNGRLIFTFHHWKPQSWTALTLALRGADFRLVNRYVVHSENPISVHVANLRAITDDAILVLAPAEAGVDRTWDRPPRVRKSASNQFCRDCATLLGWLLAQDISEDAMKLVWRDALRDGR